MISESYSRDFNSTGLGHVLDTGLIVVVNATQEIFFFF